MSEKPELIPVHCNMLKGYVEGGTSTEVTFTFSPTAPGVISIYVFHSSFQSDFFFVLMNCKSFLSSSLSNHFCITCLSRSNKVLNTKLTTGSQHKTDKVSFYIKDFTFVGIKSTRSSKNRVLKWTSFCNKRCACVLGVRIAMEVPNTCV